MKSDTDSEIISFLPFSHLHFMYSKNRFTASEAVFLSLIYAITMLFIHELIDHSDVYEAEGTGKNKTQRIVIYYRFVGNIEIPSDEVNLKLDMRQGMAVEYLTA